MQVFLAGTYGAHVSVISLCMFLIGQGSHGFYTVSAMTNIANWPSSKQGKVMGYAFPPPFRR